MFTPLTIDSETDERVEESDRPCEVAVGDQQDGRTSDVAGMQRAGWRAAAAVVVIVLAVGGLAGWLGCRALQAHRVAAQRDMFVQMARQEALDLTTIDYAHVDSDVQRILDSSTGKFREDFQSRSRPFVDVVKHAQSKSEGTIAAAGLESLAGDSARILVAVAVKTTSAGNQSDTKAWRMRIDVQKDGDSAKMSNAEFVP
jgi:Mce-associated membrane protein